MTMSLKINGDSVDFEMMPTKQLSDMTSRLGDTVIYLDEICNTMLAVKNAREDAKRGMKAESIEQKSSESDTVKNPLAS